jgi:acyl-CoA synthetase (AMP-forming)/AMP-acid ligase II
VKKWQFARTVGRLPRVRGAGGSGGNMIIEDVFRYAHSTPEKIALWDRGQAITYAEFAYWIAHAREEILKQNLRAGTIAVLMELPCRLDGWVFDIALRSLGHTTMSVFNLSALNELEMRNIGCVLTKSTEPVNITLAPGETAPYTLIRLPDGLFERKKAGPAGNLPPIVSPRAGHIRLTSGTTGVRKKVLLSDEVIAAETRRRAGFWEFRQHSVVNAFAFALWSGLGYYLPQAAWSVGATVVFHQTMDPNRSLLIEGMSHAFFTPATLREFFSTSVGEIPKNPAMRVVVGGGPLPLELYQAVKDRITSNIYTIVSSTEAGPWGFTLIESPEDLRSHKVIPSMQVQVVDENENVLPPGQLGTVRVRINGVSSYVDNEEASRRFFRNGYFYPGDLGSFDERGRLALRGRFTNVINVFGDKISAEPIEQALQQKLGVEDVCVLSIPRENTGEELHIAIQTQHPIDAETLQTAIAGQIASFAFAKVHFFTALPRVDMGKVDRITLRQQIWATLEPNSC